MSVYLSSLFKDILARCRILGGQIFFLLSILWRHCYTIAFLFCLPWEICCPRYLCYSVCNKCFFSGCFEEASLHQLVLGSLIVMCLDVIFFVFLVLRVEWISCTSVFVVFIKSGIFSAHFPVLKYFFCHSSLPPLFVTSNRYIRPIKESHSAVSLFFFFFFLSMFFVFPIGQFSSLCL